MICNVCGGLGWLDADGAWGSPYASSTCGACGGRGKVDPRPVVHDAPEDGAAVVDSRHADAGETDSGVAGE